MSDLKLESLRIQNFRTFKDLTIDRLGRVNLIVGKNNVGKTALLEALWIWGHPEYWLDLIEFLGKQFPDQESEPQRLVVKRRYQVLKNRFHGYPDFSEGSKIEVRIGPLRKKGNILIVELRFPGSQRVKIIQEPSISVSYSREEEEGESSIGSISIMNPGESTLRYNEQNNTVNFVASDGIWSIDAGRLWDEAIRENQKHRILEALRIVAPSANDVNWITEPSLDMALSGSNLRHEDGHKEERVPMVQLSTHQQAVPVFSLGEGASRALWIGSSLVNSRNGILAIDEIENGLHYSVQPDLWRMIFETAQELDVQVFATTHSHDCVRAFQQVSSEHEEEGMLISLRRKQSDPEDIVAVPIEEEELEYAVESHTDVR